MGSRVIFAGGGTGGHVYPAIAMAKKLVQRNPDIEIMFVGADRGMENQIVPREGFRLTTLDVISFPRRISVAQIKSVHKAILAMLRAYQVLREFRPGVVVGTGGYAAGPIVLMAALLGYPTLIHEQNAFPSLTNRLLARFVSKIAVSHSAALTFFPIGKVSLTGNPLREEVLRIDSSRARGQLGISPEEKVLLMVGGSGGARVLNEVLSKCYSHFVKRRVRIIHVSGKRDYDMLRSVAEPYLGHYLELLDYATDLPSLIAAADLVISRPGSTTAELAYLAKPSILIPAPIAADNHQEHNAQVFAEAGAAVLIAQGQLNPERLLAIVSEVIFDPERLSQMSERAKALALPRATDDLCAMIEGLLPGE